MINNQQRSFIATQLPFIDIKTPVGNMQINFIDILYIKADNKHSIIYFLNKESIKSICLLKCFEAKLQKPYFYRCHDSFIVNCLYVHCTCANEIILHGNIRVPLSRYKTQGLKENMICLHRLIIVLLHTKNLAI